MATRPDVVHVATPGALGLAGLILARRFGVPIVTTHHTLWRAFLGSYLASGFRPLLQTVMDRLLAWMFSQSRMTIVHSKVAERDARRLGVTSLRYIPMGISVANRTVCELIRERAAARKRLISELCLDPRDPIVLYVGRLGREKSLGTLLDAVRRAAHVLVVAGDGPLLSSLKNEQSVKCLGIVQGSALEQLYLAADLFVSAAMHETFGRAVHEALAHGTPVLIPDRRYEDLDSSNDGDSVFTFTEEDVRAGKLGLRVDAALQIAGQPVRSSVVSSAVSRVAKYSLSKTIDCHEDAYIVAVGDPQ